MKEHDCRMKWRGNSKAVDSDLAVDMLVSANTGKDCI